MTSQRQQETIAQGAQAQLERAYIEQYLNNLGYTEETLRNLPEMQVRQIMSAASLFASIKLTEVEARSHWAEELHGGPTQL
ncbi:MAG TPA: hypothetical protein VFZ66_24240 [Herpetosiphonaceae bacterium]